MIENSLLFYQNKILSQTAEASAHRIPQQVLEGLPIISRSPCCKVIQLNAIVLAVCVHRFKTDTMTIACYGQATDPQTSMRFSTDLAEMFISDFARKDLADPAVLAALRSAFAEKQEEANRALVQKQERIDSLNRDLDIVTESTARAAAKFVDRGRDLQGAEEASLKLSQSALNFELGSRVMREQLARQRRRLMFIFLVLSSLVLLAVLIRM